MPQFAIYANPVATAPDRILLALADAGFTDFDYVTVDMRGREHKTPEYLARNPFGKVPALVTNDGITMHESRAITRFLCTRLNLPLIPNPATASAASQALFEQELSCETSYFEGPVSGVIWETFIKRLIGMETDDAAVVEHKKKLDDYFDIVEAKFKDSGKKFMAGEEYTLADVYYLPFLARLFDRGFGELVTSRPHVKAWWERCMERPKTKAWIDQSPKLDLLLAKMEAK
ncbi:glutathione S-transferase PARB [Arthroderma uncinatum]|uniref:glutathione S-transferase PARB n=1 Tax=Arthroderma uncinatum TaxID=74035 RepID=UPI00144A8966|nr:glutathione S-transferase PARB [Arthroderma uncinatum]KAF3481458.1 glutathione S-transferase PARB [Arthroderma uncinatum]